MKPYDKQIGGTHYQPRKVEEILPNDNIVADTYIIYPTGGHHFFYGVSNTLPRYQLPIWPYIKRIKYSSKNYSKKYQKVAQLSTHFLGNYLAVGLTKEGYYLKNDYTRIKKNGVHTSHKAQNKQSYLMHRLVALAWIPNLENKPLIMHINDDPTNYLIENLKWGTRRENMKGKINSSPETREQKYQNFINRGFIKE